MKKLSLFSIAAVFAAATTYAQSTSFGFKAGANANSLRIKTDGGAAESRVILTKPGFHGGGIADIAFSPNFSIQPQLLFATKGGKVSLTAGSETDFSFLTIDLPINFLYHTNGFFIGGGPNFSYGLSGKGKVTASPDVDLYEDDALGMGNKFTRLEIGANVMMGYRFASGFLFSSNWTPGITDQLKEGDTSSGEGKVNNSYFGFSVGYMFGRAKKK